MMSSSTCLIPPKFPKHPRLSRTLLCPVVLALSACAAPHPAPPDTAGSTGSDATLASIVARLGADGIDVSLRTHVYLVGYSNGTGELFYRSALASALRRKEWSEGDQILLVRSRETGLESDLELTRRNGVRIVTADLDKVTGEAVLAFLDRFPALASVNFHGHSSAWGLGLEIDESHTRLSTDTPRLSRLANNFAPGAMVLLNGCNNGLILAPVLAKEWGVPVSGVQGSADFQQLHVDGNWYFNNPGQAPDGGWAKRNTFSYSTPMSCLGSSCVRMKPDNVPYRGSWGNFDGGGLPFAKTFCPAAMPDAECQTRMALSLAAFPSVRALGRASPASDFEAVARDFLCPISPKDDLRGACEAVLARVKETRTPVVYSPFKGNSLSCDFRGCDVGVQCDQDSNGFPLPGRCYLVAPTNRAPTALAREYLHYLAGIEELTRSSHSDPTPGPTAAPSPVPTARPTVVPTARPTVVPTARPTVVPTLTPIDTSTAPVRIGPLMRSFTLGLRVARTYRASEWIDIPGEAQAPRAVRKIEVLRGDQRVAEALTHIVSGRFLLRFRLPAGTYRLTFRSIEDGSGNIVAIGQETITLLAE